jgi:SAM-dependent methyltransferase
MEERVQQRCRFCGTALETEVVDLGMSPLCESYVFSERANEMEPFYPLKVMVCEACRLVQIDQFVSAEQIFSDYAYFSSFSSSWLRHAAEYTDAAVKRFSLDSASFVVELASNDGYLLRNFVEKGIPCLGVEPAANVAREAEKAGVPTLVRFFGADTAREMAADGQMADLVVGNNVLAQVPDLNDFVEGIGILLKPSGVATLEFPHLMQLMEQCQYDTIYHEHFCYFAWITVERIFAMHGLRLFDVDELPTHGGSIRIYACHEANKECPMTHRANAMRQRELDAGYDQVETYTGFGEQVRESKRSLLSLLIELKRCGKKIAGYGAPGKGNTLLNYCGIRTDFIDFTVDRNPYKQGMQLPGTRIPIFPVEKIDEERPDYLLILPWNLKEEIMEQMGHVRSWGCRFIIPIPSATVLD